MAIIALIVAGLFAWLGLGDRFAPAQRRFLLLVAVAAAGFALFLIVARPQEAWDLHWVGRLMTRMGGHAVREMLR